MSAFRYIEINRTLYRNFLETNAAKGRDIMDQNLREDIRAFTHKVTSFIKRINAFIGKVVMNECHLKIWMIMNSYYFLTVL